MIQFENLTLQDALDLAIMIEEEAEERYLEFAEQIGERYSGDAADFFKMMAGNEAKHARQLKERRTNLFGSAPTNVTRDMIWDVEAPNAGKPRTYMSVREALEIAMESEVKAYQFFYEALKQVKMQNVIRLFEELRDEELEHQAALKKQLAKLPPTKGADLSDDDIDEPGAH